MDHITNEISTEKTGKPHEELATAHSTAAAQSPRISKNMNLMDVWIHRGLIENSNRKSGTPIEVEDSYSQGITITPQSPLGSNKKLSPSSLSGIPKSLKYSNHPKRLRSEICREHWILAKKAAGPSISEDDEAVLNLSTLIADHSRQFPLSVKVVREVEGEIPSTSIMNIHFIKHFTVIHIIDAINRHYLIPFNSTVTFGIIYSPGIKSESFFFEKVSDIIQASDLPKVVTCTKKSKSKDSDSGVSQNEVLIVIKVIRGHSKSSKKPKLKVFSFTHKKEKLLSSDIIGRFTTEPKVALFYVPDIIQYIPDPFPLTARLYLDRITAGCPPLPDILARDPVVILENTIERSVIASLSHDSEPNTTSAVNKELDAIELLVREDIAVTLIDDKRRQLSSIEALYADTHKIWKSMMTPPSGSTVLPRLILAEKDTVQYQLFGMVREDMAKQGQAIEMPPLVKDLPVDTDHSSYEVLLSDRTHQTSCGSHHTPHLSSYSSSMSSASENCRSSDAESVGREPSEDLFINPQETDKTDKFHNQKMKSPLQSVHKPTEYHSTHRLVRRIEALEFRVANTVPQNAVHRLSRRIESLESHFLSEIPLSTESRKESSGRESILGKESGVILGKESGVILRKESGVILGKESGVIFGKESGGREKKLEHEVEELRLSLKLLNDEVKEMRKKNTEILEKISNEDIKENVAAQYTEETKEINIGKLRIMDTPQIGELLEELHLNQYKKTFTDEMVNGEILAECDEEVLVQDLGIKNKIHCSKLMRVIRGQYSLKAGKDISPN